MRLIKALGLALVAVVAAVAIINPGSASPEGGDSELVICEVNKALCPPGKYYVRKGVTLRAKDVVFLGVLEAESCSKAELTGRLVGMGNPLLMEIFTLAFYGTCTPCPTITVENVSHGLVKVAANDVYTMLLSFKAKLSCPAIGESCKFEVPDAVLAIHNNAAGLPEFLAVEQEIKVEESKFLCGTIGAWDAQFNEPAYPLKFWFALYELTQHESELKTEKEHQETLESHEEDLEKE